VGGTQFSFSLVQAAHGHEFVVAESHLIFRRRHPSQARITAGSNGQSMHLGYADMEAHPSTVCVGCVRQRRHNLAKSVVSAELGEKIAEFDPLLCCGSRGPKTWGANEMLCACVVCGRRGREVGSPAMSGIVDFPKANFGESDSSSGYDQSWPQRVLAQLRAAPATGFERWRWLPAKGYKSAVARLVLNPLC